MPPNIRAKPSSNLHSDLHVCLSRRLSRPPRVSQLDRLQQKRWITRNHIRRIKEAMDDWSFRAKAIRDGQKQSMLSFLEERGFVNQIIGTRTDLDNLLIERRVGAYVGVDPTAPSLHIGHMVSLMPLAWLYIHGYSITFLVGGTTAKIGDPTSRIAPRDRLSNSERRANLASIHLQLKKLGARVETHAKSKGYIREWAWRRQVANNSEIQSRVLLSDFMRVIGFGARMGPLLGRETVKNRLEKGEGMSFAEFSYPLIQALDWWILFKKGVQIQIGGADQFGNILTGVEAIKAAKKVEPVTFEADATMQGHVGSSPTVSHDGHSKGPTNLDEPIGFTVPLLTSTSGTKFSKSEGNAIWLDAEMTSTFDLYQFFLRCSDDDVERYLKLFTFLDMAEIQTTMDQHLLDQSKRVAQHRLAFEFVALVHGSTAAQTAQGQHKRLFDKSLSVDTLQTDAAAALTTEARACGERPPGDWNNVLNKYAKPTTLENAPSVHLTLPRSLVIHQTFAKILWSAGLVSSKSEGQRLISNRGCHVGSRIGKREETQHMGDSLTFTPITDTSPLKVAEYIEGDLLIVRIGKWKMKIIKIVDDGEYEKLGLTCPGWKGDEGETEAVNSLAERQRLKEFRTEKNQKRLGRSQKAVAEQQSRRPYQIEEE